MRLSPNFTLEEFLVSETAVRQGINNTPSEAVVANLKRLAERLEEVRAIFNSAVVITSGYRCKALNDAIKGAKDSAHMYGRAADFIVPAAGPPLQTAIRINQYATNYNKPVFDQLINEYDSWVHFGIEAEGTDARRQTMTYKRGGGFFTFLC